MDKVRRKCDTNVKLWWTLPVKFLSTVKQDKNLHVMASLSFARSLISNSLRRHSLRMMATLSEKKLSGKVAIVTASSDGYIAINSRTFSLCLYEALKAVAEKESCQYYCSCACSLGWIIKSTIPFNNLIFKFYLNKFY